MSICDGLAALIQAHMSAPVLDIAALLRAMVGQIEANWAASPRRRDGKRPSPQNWRFRPMLTIAEHNQSPEKTLEKAIVTTAPDTSWANQVPTASGLYQAHRDRHRNIDLVRRRGPGTYDFIELKVGSNTPTYAALEVLQYAALYSFARRHYSEHERAQHELLQADTIHLRVLAPAAYYRTEPVADLDRSINQGLAAFGTAEALAWTMDFAFLAFPARFVWPCGAADLQAALSDIHPVVPEQQINDTGDTVTNA
jgi:hypothetical protein